MRKLFRLIFGFLLILTGIVGLIMPIMPGWVFIIPGLVILGEFFPPVQRLVDWARVKLEGEIAKRRTGTPAPNNPPVTPSDEDTKAHAGAGEPPA